MHHVLYVSDMRYNLVSVGNVADKGIYSKFCEGDVKFKLVEKELLIGIVNRDEDI